MDSKASVDEQIRRSVIEKMWLNYFNNGLLEQGLITEEEHRKMRLEISGRKPGSPAR